MAYYDPDPRVRAYTVEAKTKLLAMVGNQATFPPELIRRLDEFVRVSSPDNLFAMCFQACREVQECQRNISCLSFLAGRIITVLRDRVRIRCSLLIVFFHARHGRKGARHAGSQKHAAATAAPRAKSA